MSRSCLAARRPSLRVRAAVGSGPVAALLLVLCSGCGKPSVRAGTQASTRVSAADPVTGNPLQGVAGFVAPDGYADQARKRLEKESPGEAALLAKIADKPQGVWFGGWSPNIQIVVNNYVNAAERKGQVPLLVAYNVPNRDCGLYSRGGASDPEVYEKWIRDYAEGIGDRRAVVVLEPDATAQLDDCLSPEDQAQRLELIAFAVEVLESKPGVAVYIDAGHSNWQPAEVMAERLRKAGVAKARGFALNVSNYQADESLIAFGKRIVELLGTDTHFIIDSSRNGNGPAPASDPEGWCNPEGRALGRAPTADTGEPLLDAFVWVKKPGESDGECKGGPPAGQWFEARALEMARNCAW